MTTKTTILDKAMERLYLFLLYEILDTKQSLLEDLVIDGDSGLVGWDRFVEEIYLNASVDHGFSWDPLEDDDRINPVMDCLVELYGKDERLGELCERFEEQMKDEDGGPVSIKALFGRIRKIARDELLLFIK